MDPPGPRSRAWGDPRWLPVAVIGLTLALFAGTLGYVNSRLRDRLREQIGARDAEVLFTVAALQTFAGTEAIESADAELLAELPPDELTVLAQGERLKQLVAGLRGVLAARFFDVQGRLVTALPLFVTDATLTAGQLERLHALKPSSRYRAAVSREELYLDAARNAPDRPAVQPVLEVLLPLQATPGGRLQGGLELILDGAGIAAQYRALDRQLWGQGAVVFVLGGGVIAIGLGWAFGRLQRANRLLAERTRGLLKANAELALAAKTSAVGAVTSHLIHGLRNPLSGLTNLVANRAPGGADTPSDTDWEAAVASTRRIRDLIDSVVRVLREDSGGAPYELSLAEFLGLLESRVAPAARSARVELALERDGETTLSNRDANLILLILENLVQNALQATPADRAVRVLARQRDATLSFEVIDQGPGVPEAARATLFLPGRTTKAGGSGIGLAISRQLAQHLGAELELRTSGPTGSCFALTLRRPG